MEASTEFRQHPGWCPSGWPSDGRRRVDLFPDWGGPLPLWVRGGMVSHASISQRLRADLHHWNDDWEAHVVPGQPFEDASWLQAWERVGEALARRVELETGSHVVMCWPTFDHRDDACPHCGEAAAIARIEQRRQ